MHLIIAGMTPISIQAKIEADIFEQICTAKANGERVTKADKMQKRRNALQSVRKAWIRGLENGGAARPAIRAVAPHWEQWTAHGTRKLTYRTTQVITRHGCFGEYLRRIGAETTAACQLCGANNDTAQHTVKECPSFSQQRRRLKDVIGPDISQSAIIRALMRGERK